MPCTRWEIINKWQISSTLWRVCMWPAYIFQTPTACGILQWKWKLCCYWKGAASKLVHCVVYYAVDEKQRPAFQHLKPIFFFLFSSLLALPLYQHVFSAAVSKACLVSYCSLFQKYQIICYADWFSKCRFSFSLKTKIILVINLAEIEYSRCRFCWGFF